MLNAAASSYPDTHAIAQRLQFLRSNSVAIPPRSGFPDQSELSGAQNKFTLHRGHFRNSLARENVPFRKRKPSAIIKSERKIHR